MGTIVWPTMHVSGNSPNFHRIMISLRRPSCRYNAAACFYRAGDKAIQLIAYKLINFIALTVWTIYAQFCSSVKSESDVSQCWRKLLSSSKWNCILWTCSVHLTVNRIAIAAVLLWGHSLCQPVMIIKSRPVSGRVKSQPQPNKMRFGGLVKAVGRYFQLKWTIILLPWYLACNEWGTEEGRGL